MREAGYYWCKYKDSWMVCYWIPNLYFVGSVFAEEYYVESKVFFEAEFLEIDESKLTRPLPDDTK